MRRLGGLVDRAVVRATVLRERSVRRASAADRLAELASIEAELAPRLRDLDPDGFFGAPTLEHAASRRTGRGMSPSG